MCGPNYCHVFNFHCLKEFLFQEKNIYGLNKVVIVDNIWLLEVKLVVVSSSSSIFAGITIYTCSKIPIWVLEFNSLGV